MDTLLDAGIARVAQDQHGVFTLAQATRVGIGREERATRLQSGRWESPVRNVYRLAGAPPTWESHLLVACLAGGERGRASHRSAAALWGLPGSSREMVEITCPRWRRARPDGLIVHESTAFDHLPTVVRNAIPVVTVDVTLLQLGAVATELVVEQALDVAVTRSLTTTASVRRTLERFAKRGRDGCATLRTILDRRAPIIGTPESPAETALLRLLLRHDLPAPTLQYEIRDSSGFVARVDAAYPEWRIALEYESYEHHTGRAALVRDSARRNRLARSGWMVIAVTAEDLRAGGHGIANTIRDIARERGPTQTALRARE